MSGYINPMKFRKGSPAYLSVANCDESLSSENLLVDIFANMLYKKGTQIKDTAIMFLFCLQ